MLKRILLSLLAILLIAAGAGFFWINTVIKKGIETYGTEITGTRVTLQSSHISFFSGSGSLNGLLVANPEGFSERPVFTFGEITLILDIRSLFSDVIKVKEIVILRPEISYEFGQKSRDTNIDALKRNMKQRNRTSGDNDEEVDKPKKKLLIENLYIKEGKIAITNYLFGKENRRETPLPEIHLRNIGASKNGLPPEQVSAEVLKALTGEMLGVVGSALKESMRNIKGALQGLFR